jgi:hypothetical protein
MRPGGREQEITQIAFDVLALVADLDPFAARADEVFQGGIQIDGVAHLIEISNLQVSPLADGSLVRCQLAQDHFEQRGLPCAIGANQSYFVPAQDGSGEIANDGLVAERLADSRQLRDDLSLITVGATGRHIHANAADHFAACFAARTQMLQAADAALAASAARFDAAAYPDFFLCQKLVGFGGNDGLLR